MPSPLAVSEYIHYRKLSVEAVGAATALLRALGIPMDTEHSELTPCRLVRYLQRAVVAPEPFHMTIFENDNPRIDEMVVVPGIPFWSMCSHHTLPFFGTATVAYIPDEWVIGLSKIPLLVRHKAQGLWLQEHLAHAIVEELMSCASPLGAAVSIRAQHTCQLLDLKQPPIPEMVQTALRGCFHPLDPDYKGVARSEFLGFID